MLVDGKDVDPVSVAIYESNDRNTSTIPISDSKRCEDNRLEPTKGGGYPKGSLQAGEWQHLDIPSPAHGAVSKQLFRLHEYMSQECTVTISPGPGRSSCVAKRSRHNVWKTA